MTRSATYRLKIMSEVIAIAEDRELVDPGKGVSFTELAKRLETPIEVLRTCVEPIRWVELVAPDGFFVDLVGCVEVTEDDRVVVTDGWWRKMAVPSPGQAARLCVQAAAAAALGGEVAACLVQAMRKLRRLVGGVFVQEPEPPAKVARLRRCADAGKQVALNMEGPNLTIVDTDAVFDPLAVFRVDDEWRVALRSVSGDVSLGVKPGEMVVLPVDRIFSMIETGEVFEPAEYEELPMVIDVGRSLEVTIELSAAHRWMLDPFDVLEERRTAGEDRVVDRVRIDGLGALRTLLLRLGTAVRLIEPPELRQIQKDVAAAVLALYE